MHVKLEQVDRIFADAWVKALGATGMVSESINAKLTESPAMEATSDDRKSALSEAAWLTLIADTLYTNNVAIFFAVKHGIIPHEFLVQVEEQFRAFTIMALTGGRAVCKSPGCEWRGEIRECGPSGFCPKCGKRSAEPFSLERAMTEPPVPNGLTTPSGIIIAGEARPH